MGCIRQNIFVVKVMGQNRVCFTIFCCYKENILKTLTIKTFGKFYSCVIIYKLYYIIKWVPTYIHGYTLQCIPN